MEDSVAEARRSRRQRTRRVEIDRSIPSPCISVCQIDEETNFCIGCYRDIDEIRDWIIMSAEEKIARAEAQALSEVRGQAADLAVAAAREIIRERMDSSGAQNALVDKAIAELRDKLN